MVRVIVTRYLHYGISNVSGLSQMPNIVHYSRARDNSFDLVTGGAVDWEASMR